MNTRARKSDPFSPKEVEDLLNTIQLYENEYAGAADAVAMKGKQLGECQREQASLAYYYGVKKVEVGAILKRVENRIAAIRGRLYQHIKEHSSFDLSDRMIDKYVDASDDYQNAADVQEYAEEVYKKYCEIEKAFDKRGFAIRDYTESRVHQIHKDVI